MDTGFEFFDVFPAGDAGIGYVSGPDAIGSVSALGFPILDSLWSRIKKKV